MTSAAHATIEATELDDVALERARTGDATALRALVELYQDRVFALIWRMMVGRGTERTDDLAQETFVRVLRGVHQFEPGGSAKLSTWILTIATRVVLNERRRAARDRAESDDAAIAAIASNDRADTSLERSRLSEALTTNIATLPNDQHTIFVLHEYHDLEYTEIAIALELDPNTTRSRLHRARTALRAALTAAGVEP